MPRARGGNKSSSKTPGGTLRIIGGSWRGRKLSFREADGLRPTGDRVRETLFNWIAAEVPGARCLDLFSGSGALGLEALSRGAASCDFVDSSSAALSRLREDLRRFPSEQSEYPRHTAAALNEIDSSSVS